MEPIQPRKPGLTAGDVGSFLSTLFHAGIVLIGVGILALGLLAWVVGGLTDLLGLN